MQPRERELEYGRMGSNKKDEGKKWKIKNI